MAKRRLIGTDEAGYGPNLGPLVVAGTLWEVPDDLNPMDLWESLQSVLTCAPERNDRRLHVADSKAVYSANRSLEDLEVPVLAFLGSLGCSAETLDSLGEQLAGPSFRVAYESEVWNAVPGLTMPAASSAEHIQEWQSELQAELQAADVRLVAIRTAIVFPRQFNSLVDAAGSKGAVLSETTLRLVAELMAVGPSDQAALVVCDKHGGRNRYDEVIASQFDDEFVFRLEESRHVSRYRMGRTEFCFRTKAEELLPVALSSMVAKYLREVLMRQFNHYWSARIPGLRPTQGYPLDARRFRDEISETFALLGISESDLWRNR
jgi:ribonuclease HII